MIEHYIKAVDKAKLICAISFLICTIIGIWHNDFLWGSLFSFSLGAMFDMVSRDLKRQSH